MTCPVCGTRLPKIKHQHSYQGSPCPYAWHPWKFRSYKNHQIGDLYLRYRPFPFNDYLVAKAYRVVETHPLISPYTTVPTRIEAYAALAGSLSHHTWAFPDPE